MWGALLLVCLLPSGAAGSPDDPPCAECLVLGLDAASARTVIEERAPVDGLSLLLGPGAHGHAATLAALGGRVWLETTAAAEWVAPAELAFAVGLVLEAGAGAPAVFAVQHTATAARAARPDLRLVLELSGDLAGPAPAPGVAAYVDGVLVPRPDAGRVAEAVRAYPGLDVWVPSGRSHPLDASAGPGVAAVVARPRDALAAVRLLAAVRGWLPAGLTPLPEVTVACEGCRSRVWMHPETLDAIAVLEGVRGDDRVRIGPGAVRVRMAGEGASESRALPIERLEDAATVRLPAVQARRVVLAITGWRGTEEEIYRTGVEVTAARTLTVEEIVARHQAQRARQRATVQSVISSGTTVLSFEVPGFPAPVSVSAETTVYTRGALTDIAQTSIRVNGADMSLDGRVPRVPIIDAERVSTPPLTIALTAAYAYRLEGRERRQGRDAYLVSFAPVRTEGAAVRGRAWIDASTFALLRMEATQTGLRGAIVSSEQHDEYGRVEVAGREVWLPVRSSSFQIYQAAGLRTPIHREIVTPVHDVNPPDFERRLAEAHASRAVMLRDTPEGFQYLVPPGPGGDPARRVVAEGAGRRVTSLVFGMLVDPNITVPLPYAGLSYLDFDFLQRGVQLSAFFGGAYGQLAWTVPGVVRPGWQLTGRVFGIGVSYNDRSFRDGLERYDENILQRPFRSSATLVAPLSPRVQVRLGYDFEHTTFRRGDDTAPSFVVPRNAVVHAARLGLDVQRGPWSGLLWWSPARRQGWQPWGRDGEEPAAGAAAFQRYGATLARSWVVSPGSVAKVEASWMGGRHLDRFSRYTFDSLENRLRGYPSAGLRYDRGAVLRTVATWAPVPRLRLDGFADYALVRDPGFGDRLRSYPGVGAAAEVPLPGRMLVGLEWGYGVEARNTDGSRGTHVIRVSGVKVF